MRPRIEPGLSEVDWGRGLGQDVRPVSVGLLDLSIKWRFRLARPTLRSLAGRPPRSGPSFSVTCPRRTRVSATAHVLLSSRSTNTALTEFAEIGRTFPPTATRDTTEALSGADS